MYPHELSGGQRQRVGLARALILNPRLIVADEPVSALDVSVQAQVLNLMRTLQERHELSYVVISHDLSVIRYLANEIAVMYLGKVVEVAPPRDLYEQHSAPLYAGRSTRSRSPIPPRPAAAPGSSSPGNCRRRSIRRRAAGSGPGARWRRRSARLQEPPLRPFGAGHRAACHFPLREPVGAAN